MTTADHLRDAVKAQNRATANAIEHARAIASRDEAILDAYESGASYPELADALGLHPSRIKQVLTAQRKARRG